MEWQKLLFGEEDSSFLIETGIRTVIMFLVILTSLRLLGKRGIHQLSVFELGVIIGLGSAAGDPMFYKDVGLLPSILVFIVVVLMYRGVTFLISSNDKIETLIEGRATYILRDGQILKEFKKQPLAKDELFARLRQSQVYHLGQVETVIIESDGGVSMFFAPDDKVIDGLPILPHLLDDCMTRIDKEGVYSCASCGYTQRYMPLAHFVCKECNHDECVKSINGLRVK
ncbi:MAG TPA: YetF domain-containing protein [Chryseosolibacter sp.]